jgi:hypothetical protein
MRVARKLEQPPDADFVRRNYYKCVQALGDSPLIAHRCYTTSYQGRDRALIELSTSSPEVAAFRLEQAYQTSLQFKFSPDSVPEQAPDEAELCALARQWGDVFLFIERKRTGYEWASLNEYARWQGIREPGENTPAKWLRNLLRNRQTGLWRWRYPREWLYRRLPGLLGLLDISPAPWPQESARFLEIWRLIN